MRTTKNILSGLIISLAISGTALVAGATARPRTMEDRVRHEILSAPYINVLLIDTRAEALKAQEKAQW